MKRATLLLLVVLFGTAHSVTLSDLRGQFRSATGETDTASSWCSDADVNSWLNTAQDVIVRLGGYLEKTYEFSVLEDSLSVVLPADFRYPIKALVMPGDVWEPLLRNEGFTRDTSELTGQYDVAWKNRDTALLYLKGVKGGNRVRFVYNGLASSLTSDTSTCEAPDDLQGFIVQEAEAYYLMAMKDYASALALQDRIRKDMGLSK